MLLAGLTSFVQVGYHFISDTDVCKPLDMTRVGAISGTEILMASCLDYSKFQDCSGPVSKRYTHQCSQKSLEAIATSTFKNYYKLDFYDHNDCTGQSALQVYSTATYCVPWYGVGQSALIYQTSDTSTMMTVFEDSSCAHSVIATFNIPLLIVDPKAPSFCQQLSVGSVLLSHPQNFK